MDRTKYRVWLLSIVLAAFIMSIQEIRKKLSRTAPWFIRRSGHLRRRSPHERDPVFEV